jgi:hypothetical protein
MQQPILNLTRLSAPRMVGPSLAPNTRQLP